MQSSSTFTLLGCGTSTGVPVPGCGCTVCQSEHPRNSRTRTSAYIQTGDMKGLLIDAGPDLREQALREKITQVDDVLLTHQHADHILGLDDLRVFNFRKSDPINLFSTETTFRDVSRMFSYIFNKDPLYQGGKIADLDVKHFLNGDSIEIQGKSVQTIPLLHGNMEVSGFRFGELSYLTDCSSIPEPSLKLLTGTRYLIINGLRHSPEHATHFTIPEAIEISQQIRPEQTIFIHMAHCVDYPQYNASLPAGFELGFDGLKITFDW